MDTRAVSTITSWHAHVYFDAGTREAAWRLRETVGATFDAEVGRFHERPLGPHPCWSFQVAFPPELFATIVPWLALNRGALDVLVHPLSGDDLADHRDFALWLGRSHALDLAALEG
jgi:DOPA 4,5-dioxygenase